MRVRIGAEEFGIRGSKQRLLLAHLVLSEGRPVAVDTLINDLWSNEPPRNAAHALQAHTSRLRATLGVQIEFVEEAGYRLPGDQFDTDIQRFTDLASRARERLRAGDSQTALRMFEQAHDLWQGPALGDLPDAEGLRPVVQHVQEMRRAAQTDRIEAYLRCDRGPEVIGELRGTLEQDPLDEPSWRQLMLALDQDGRRSEALTLYHRAREVFIEELGAEPTDTLARTHLTLLELDEQDAAMVSPRATNGAGGPGAGAGGRADGSGQPGGGSGGPGIGGTSGEENGASSREDSRQQAGLENVQHPAGLVGRRHEIGLLTGAWRGPALQIATVSGPPGIGKSWLAETFAQRAAGAPSEVFFGYCQPSVTTPYQPFAEMFRAWRRRDEGSEAVIRALTRHHADGLAQVFPEFGSRDGEHDGADADQRTGAEDDRSMEAIAAWLEALSAAQRLVLVIDDVHWADEQTVLLVQHLIRTPRTINALIILTVREHALRAAQRDSPGRVLRESVLRQSSKVTHVPLSRLDEEETAELLRREAERFSTVPLPAWAEPYVRDASGGNPLFVVELTRHLLTSGAATFDHVPPLPTGLREVIESQVRSLPADVQRVLGQAAAIGTTFQTPILAEVAGLEPEDLDDLLAEATSARMVEPAPHGPVRHAFGHDVIRTVLHDAQPPSERARLHGRVAAAIKARHGDAPDDYHLDLAHHYRFSDHPQAVSHAARHLHLAGRDALKRGAAADAEMHFSEALELLGPRAEAAQRCDVLIGLGEAQLRCARPEYRETLLEATRLATTLSDPQRLATAALLNSRGWWSSTAQVDHERVAGIEAALAACDPDNLSVRARLLAVWAQENVRDPASRALVLERGAQAVELAERSGDTRALATALANRYASTYALFEDPFECVRIADRLLNIANQSGDRRLRLSAALCVAQANMRFGQFAVADRYTTQAAQLAEALEHPPRLWLVRGWQAMRAAMRGRLQEAEELAAATCDLGMRTDQADAATWYAGQVFTIRMVQRSEGRRGGR